MKYLPVIFLLTFLFSACSEKPEASPQPDSPKSNAIFVKTAQVERSELSPSIHASGMVGASNEARVSFKTGGIIRRTFVDEGDFVKAGQLLATLDLTEIEAQVQQAKEGLEKSKRDLHRAENLLADSIATLEQVQNATTAVEVAGQNVHIAEFNKQFSEIRSPFAGKVVAKLLNEGEVTGPGMPVFYLIGTGQQDWVVKVGLSHRDWARLHEGDQAQVHLDAYPAETFPAAVTKLADVANPMSGTFDAELKLNPKGKRLAAGLVASVELQPRKNGAYALIPIESLVESDGNKGFVYAPGPDGKAQKVQVTIAFLIGEKVAISSGLDGIATVVTAGAPYLRDGQLIKINK
ncbi:MAG: efflux RND transporter periplasmic adaptor subunit [Saprospirales bacterium]|nr:efflux RND transporter periplasmic adaptor subunit [Saprospirales bacterium]